MFGGALLALAVAAAVFLLVFAASGGFDSGPVVYSFDCPVKNTNMNIQNGRFHTILTCVDANGRPVDNNGKVEKK